MKIIRLTTSLDFGGQEKQYISFTNHPQLLRHNYFFGCLGQGGFTEKDLKSKGFKVRVFGNNPSITNISNIWSIYRWFLRIKPDIVHTAVGEANFHGILAAKLAGVKIAVAEEVGIPSHSKIAVFVFRLIYRLADKVICVSNSVKDHLVSIKEIKSWNSQVIYNPVSFPSDFNRVKQPNFTIVCVGRLEKVKNQQLLISSLPKIEDQRVQLILVGDGSEKRNLEELINKLGIQDRVQITGFASNPFEWLEKADLFVLPSISEGFGIATVEAMQLGIPCLCSNVGGIPEFIREGQTGWLFNPESEDEFVAKLNYILQLSEDSLLEMGIKGQNAVFEKFSEEKYIISLEDFYKKMAGND
ncbi:glycosyltransferase [Litoribacter ruber]|uniref:glycosyltransferase n=1 Tax=Litoribacter ruber TaxID=702568 RepID=UPI001BD9D45C|nr:glycosyltransferase [Litoribacter ruber]MBT0813049.1 glycosyltransferase [Litoribacter ruber]